MFFVRVYKFYLHIATLGDIPPKRGPQHYFGQHIRESQGERKYRHTAGIWSSTTDYGEANEESAGATPERI